MLPYVVVTMCGNYYLKKVLLPNVESHIFNMWVTIGVEKNINHFDSICLIYTYTLSNYVTKCGHI